MKRYSSFFLLILSCSFSLGCTTFTTGQPQDSISRTNDSVATLTVHRFDPNVVPTPIREESTALYVELENHGQQTLLSSAGHISLMTEDGVLYQPVFVPPWQNPPAPPASQPIPLNPAPTPQQIPSDVSPQTLPKAPPETSALEQPSQTLEQPLPVPANWKRVNETPSIQFANLESTSSFKNPSQNEIVLTPVRMTPSFRGGFGGGARITSPAPRFVSPSRPYYGGRSYMGARPWIGPRPYLGSRPWGYGFRSYYRPYYGYGSWGYRPYGYWGAYGWYPGFSLGVGIYGLAPWASGYYGYPYAFSSSYYDTDEEPSIEQLMQQQSLPSLSLKPGTRAVGFLFFPKITMKRESTMYVIWNVHNEQNQVVSQLRVPVVLQEDTE